MDGTHQASAAGTPALLIIGATGGIGGEVAKQALALGWQVRALTRHLLAEGQVSGHQATALRGLEWRQGDAMSMPDVVAAAQGMTFILHAANPPGYVRWRALALPMLSNAIEAARSSGARLILPGNVYNFGPDAGALVSETSPQHPLTRKGLVRVEMEAMLAQAAKASSPVRSLVVRAGDFFGPHAPSSWLGHLLVKPGHPLRRVTYPGQAHVGHAWAYLPDLAEAMLALMTLSLTEPQRMADAEVVHFAGHWLPHGIEMARAIAEVSSCPDLPIKSLPWGLLRWLSPFVPVLREMTEMRYLWEQPLQLDNRKLQALVGQEPHTPLHEALRQTLLGLGCLHGPSPRSSARAKALTEPVSPLR